MLINKKRRSVKVINWLKFPN